MAPTCGSHMLSKTGSSIASQKKSVILRSLCSDLTVAVLMISFSVKSNHASITNTVTDSKVFGCNDLSAYSTVTEKLLMIHHHLESSNSFTHLLKAEPPRHIREEVNDLKTAFSITYNNRWIGRLSNRNKTKFT